LPPSSASRSGSIPTAGASTDASRSRAQADRVPLSGNSTVCTSQPYETARLIGRTPWTRNSAALWRLLRLPTSDCHRWNDALRVVIFKGPWPPLRAEPTVSAMDVRWISAAGVASFTPDDLPTLRARTDGLVWVDVPAPNEDDIALLGKAFGFHPLALRDCAIRNPVPKVHLYPDHAFVVLHGPKQGAAGHVHYIELDQFIGPGYLVTVHGPVNPAVAPEVAVQETTAVLKRLESGRLRPETSQDLSYAVVTALTNRLREYVSELTAEVWQLEQRVTAGHIGNPEEFLEDLFAARHGLLTVRTMATLSREVYGRMAKLQAFGVDGQHRLEDMVDQFSRICTIAEGQKDYLQGVIEFYQTRTNTKMTIAAERLAVIAAVTLPVTALSSILGMNLIVNARTHYLSLSAALTVMAIMSTLLLVWAKRRGWW
jgi:Mg2+ and Co2+ transporter CorA